MRPPESFSTIGPNSRTKFSGVSLTVGVPIFITYVLSCAAAPSAPSAATSDTPSAAAAMQRAVNPSSVNAMSSPTPVRFRRRRFVNLLLRPLRRCGHDLIGRAERRLGLRHVHGDAGHGLEHR